MYHKNYYKKPIKIFEKENKKYARCVFGTKPIYLRTQAHEVKNHVTGRQEPLKASEIAVLAITGLFLIGVAVRLVLGV